MFTLRTGKKLFVKLSPKTDNDVFLGEFAGLKAMGDTKTILVPQALHHDNLKGPRAGSWIAMEHIDMAGSVNQERLGTQLAQMHLAEPTRLEEGKGQFGFEVDNTIGSTPQINDWTEDWVEFLRDKRLWPQIKRTNDVTFMRMGETVLSNRLDSFFADVKVKPSVLHGDLWSGNVASNQKGEPVIFDPACYHGHHEAEFGMSWSANFTGAFYGAYHDVIPKEPGFDERLDLYTLYHYLNHFNIFGGSYYSSCERLLKKFA
mmetsp:Transcript_15296/g.38916  ORF Transcript_15296/g.38916 Transcript_15296/m.38916 type:complete len:260 (+) Transcript_15296:2287-3066(+)